MKFSDIEESSWGELKPYLDTCILPLTGLDGTEAPWQVTRELERLRDRLDLLEIPYRGRVVTYPAVQYGRRDGAAEWINEICANLKRGGFRYVLLVTASDRFDKEPLEADLLISPAADPDWRERLQSLWRSEAG